MIDSIVSAEDGAEWKIPLVAESIPVIGIPSLAELNWMIGMPGQCFLTRAAPSLYAMVHGEGSWSFWMVLRLDEQFVMAGLVEF